MPKGNLERRHLRRVWKRIAGTSEGDIGQAANQVLDRQEAQGSREASDQLPSAAQPTAQQKEALEAYDLKKASCAEKDKAKGSKGKGKGKGANGRQGARANSHEAPLDDSEKQDILDKGMAMLEQMRAGFGMQTHAVESSLPGAGESVIETSQLTHYCSRYFLERANRRLKERHTG